MSRNNSMGIRESLINSRDTTYPYRSGLGLLPSAEYYQYFEDFDEVPASNTMPGWQAAIIDVGATLTTYTAGPDNGGVVRITSDAASEGVSIYRASTIVLTGKKFFMEVRARTAAPTDTDLQFGLSSITATTNPEDLWTTAADSFLAFGLLDGAATGVLTYDKSNGGPQTDSAAASTFSVATSIWTTFAIAYNGATAAAVGSVQCYINGNMVVSNTVAARVPDTVILAPFIGARGGNGAIGTIDVDYFRYSIQR